MAEGTLYFTHKETHHSDWSSFEVPAWYFDQTICTLARKRVETVSVVDHFVVISYLGSSDLGF